ncbi:MAG: DUF3426 domain-containing protein [Nitrosopumilus sp. H13]|nr:MAG: DUF3426 domain-containing protein [Nitrosopumilus sp. H13]
MRILVLVMLAGFVPLASGDVYIQNDQSYRYDGLLHIVGEIKNELDAPLGQISVRATAFDGEGTPVATGEADSLVNILVPGMSGPFEIVMMTDAESYELELDYGISSPKEQVIDITRSDLTRDGHGNLMITGTVINRGEITANTVAVVATLYDSDGKVAAVSRTHPEPDYLRAQDHAFFLVAVPDKSRTAGVGDYSLVAESEEYAAVPEFPAGMFAVLAGTLAVFVALSRYAGRLTAVLIPPAGPR